MRRTALPALLLASLAPGQDAPRPNVILLMADDLGYGDLGCQGHPDLRTPEIDRMAAAGLRFTRFHAAAPVCSPTRGSCLTGRHPLRYGIRGANSGHLPADETTLQGLLKTQGYRTGHFGKWHLGTLTTEVVESNRGGPRGAEHFAPPWERGFDVCFSTEAKVPTYEPMRKPGTREPYGTHYWNERGEIVREGLGEDDSRVIMDRVVPFVRDIVAEGVPFLAVVWFHTPHLPIEASRADKGMYARFDDETQRYYGCITAMDRQVGRLRSVLGDLGVGDDTILWFCSDNGPEGRAGQAPGSAGGLRGRKRSLYEGGTRVPGILTWPRRIAAGGVTDVPAVTSDFLPTIAGWLELELPDGLVLDGVDLGAVVAGEREERGRPIGFASRDQRAWIDGRWKLFGKGDAFELYDLVEDPAESNDLAARYPERAAAMRRAMTDWADSLRPR